MDKIVFLRIDGNLNDGVEISLQICQNGSLPVVPLPEKGRLKPNPELQGCYELWLKAFLQLRSHRYRLKMVKLRGGNSDDWTIDEGGVTNVGVFSDEDVCRKFVKLTEEKFNDWLSESGDRHWMKIREILVGQFANHSENVALVIQSKNTDLWKFPWYAWDLLERYPNVGIAFSFPSGERVSYLRPIQPKISTSHKVRILVVLGSDRDIDLDPDKETILNLAEVDAHFLSKPSARELNQTLRDKQGWDIFLFAGHSESDKHKERIYISEDEFVEIADLKNSFREAISYGLKIAIFNSCQGMGLAERLADLHLPFSIVMQEPVPDRIAQAFLKEFLTEYSQGKFLYTAVRIATNRLGDFNKEWPGAYGLPIICQNPTYFPPSWQDLLKVKYLSSNPPKKCFIKNDKSLHGRGLPSFLWTLFNKLRRRHGFALGIDDYEALRQSLQAGFGWSSLDNLRDLCNALWAKSLPEQEILTSLFDQLAEKEEGWQLKLSRKSTTKATVIPISPTPETVSQSQPQSSLQFIPKTQPQPKSGLPEISLKDVKISPRPFIFVPQFPLSDREIAQTWRNLRRPMRVGAAIEVDIDATIHHRCQQGVVVPVILKPRRRNLARLLMLVDRQGSMTPFHPFCQQVCQAMKKSGRVEQTAIYYFRNVPAMGADKQVLKSLSEKIFPTLDSILSQIEPLTKGYLYADPELLCPQAVEEVLPKYATDAFVVVLSDAGAMRNYYNVSRLLDTLAFFKAVRSYSLSDVWLNPLPRNYWQKPKNNTATQISRHLPMFPLDREGLYRAVNVLRRHQYNNIEKPL